MKSIMISSWMDDEEFPEEILDYVVFAKMAYISMGYNTSDGERTEEYEAILARYPRRDEIVKAMEAIHLKLRMCPRSANTPLHGMAVTPLSGH